MKKLLSLLTALTLVFGVSVNAFATVVEPGKDVVDSPTVTIEKALTANPMGSNPAETFEFIVGAGVGLRDGEAIVAPLFVPETFTIVVEQGGTTGNSNIQLPTFTQVGVYTYPLTESTPNPMTAGMTYDGDTYNLVVTVINNPDYGKLDEPQFLRVLTLSTPNNVKTDSFKNKFDAGRLTVDKQVTGNYGDPNDVFRVTVTLLKPENKNFKTAPVQIADKDGNPIAIANILNAPITVNKDEGNSVIYTFLVQHGTIYTIKNIPYGVTYTISEDLLDNTDYTTTITGKGTGTIETATNEITITNNRDVKIATGINLDNIPYILLLAGAIAGIGVLFINKRKHANI